METITFLAKVIGPGYLILGLSLLLYPNPWKKFADNISKDHLGLMAIMFMNLIIGLMLVNTYSVWDLTWYVIITITGWGALIKSLVYFLLPGNLTMKAVKAFNSTCYLKTAGVITAILGAGLSYEVFM